MSDLCAKSRFKQETTWTAQQNNTHTQIHSYTTIHDISFSFFPLFFPSLLCRRTNRTDSSHIRSEKQPVPSHRRGLCWNWYGCPALFIICTAAGVQVSYHCPFTAQGIPGTQIQHKHTHTHTLKVSHIFPARNQVWKQAENFIKVSRVSLHKSTHLCLSVPTPLNTVSTTYWVISLNCSRTN